MIAFLMLASSDQFTGGRLHARTRSTGAGLRCIGSSGTWQPR
jgi:hypothetical protein